MSDLYYFNEEKLKINTIKINESEVRKLTTNALEPDDEDVLEYYDGPLLFVLRDDGEKSKFVMYSTEISKNKLSYYMIEKSDEEIDKYKAGTVKFPEFISAFEHQRKFMVTHNFYDEECETVISDLSDEKYNELIAFIKKPILIKEL